MTGRSGTGLEAPAAIECPNCGAEVRGRFCGECGQNRRELNRPFAELVRDALDDLLRLDGRAFRTVRLLALRPGAITAEYHAGRRVRYTPPLRLYLLASAAFFVGWRVTRPIDRAYYGLGPDGPPGYEDTLANVFILLLPVLALALRALYAFTGRRLIQHLIFSLHTGAAALLWALLLTLTAAGLKGVWRHYTGSPDWLPDFVYWLYLPGIALYLGYLAAAQRRAYGSGRIAAAVRTLVLAAATAAAFLQLLSLISRLGP